MSSWVSYTASVILLSILLVITIALTLTLAVVLVQSLHMFVVGSLWWRRTLVDAFYLGEQMGTPFGGDLNVTQSRCQNDLECSSFHHLITDDWPTDKPRGAVVMLVSRKSFQSAPGSSDTLFHRFAKHFDKNFNDAFQYPLILFHESHLNERDKKLLRSWTRSTVFFQLVKFVLPASVNESRITPRCGGLARFGMGYRHMCRFQAKTIYEEPILASDKLEYIWRLDDDSVITKPLEYDIFRFMKNHRLQYGYAIITHDSLDCIVRLQGAVWRYLKENSLQWKFPWKLPSVYYNNFEISDIRLWRSAGYIDFINYIDATAGIYTYRWGDHAIKSMAVSILVPPSATHHFNDIGYRHQFYENIGRPTSL